MKVLVTVADPRELNVDFRDSRFLLTGIGYDSVITLASYIINNGAPDLVLNVGTCVSKEKEEGHPLFQVGEFYSKNEFSESRVKCWSGIFTLPKVEKKINTTLQTVDRFITNPSQMVYPYADMEAMLQLQLCVASDIPFSCIKVVSDWAGETSTEIWESSLEQCSRLLKKKLNEILPLLNQCKQPYNFYNV